MLAVEVDGWETRKTFRAFQSDTDRQNAITLEGWMFIRFTWTDVVRRPAYVASQIAAALALLRDLSAAYGGAPSPGKVGCPCPNDALRRDAQK